jgi:hypothetical protein
MEHSRIATLSGLKSITQFLCHLRVDSVRALDVSRAGQYPSARPSIVPRALSEFLLKQGRRIGATTEPGSQFGFPHACTTIAHLLKRENVVPIHDNIANIDANPELNLLILIHSGITLSHPALNVHRATCRIHDACRLDQHSIAGSLYGTAAVLTNLWINEFASMCLELSKRAFLLDAHASTVSGDICRQDGGQTPLHALPSQVDRSP